MRMCALCRINERRIDERRAIVGGRRWSEGTSRCIRRRPFGKAEQSHGAGLGARRSDRDVLVAVAFAGVCHTQLLECRGRRGDDPYLPHCLGHEGSGTLQEIGPGVSKCRGRSSRALLDQGGVSGADVPGTVYSWDAR